MCERQRTVPRDTVAASANAQSLLDYGREQSSGVTIKCDALGLKYFPSVVRHLTHDLPTEVQLVAGENGGIAQELVHDLGQPMHVLVRSQGALDPEAVTLVSGDELLGQADDDACWRHLEIAAGMIAGDAIQFADRLQECLGPV